MKAIKITTTIKDPQCLRYYEDDYKDDPNKALDFIGRDFLEDASNNFLHIYNDVKVKAEIIKVTT